MSNTKKRGGIEVNKPAPERDTVTESKNTGHVTTDDGIKVEATSPAIPHGAEFAPSEENDNFSANEQRKLVGNLEPGDKCYLPSDSEGNVKGPAVLNKEDAGQWFIPVVVEQSGEYLITPSGAPIMRRMNPDTIKEPG